MKVIKMEAELSILLREDVFFFLIKEEKKTGTCRFFAM
jgi:hypothetical protein